MGFLQKELTVAKNAALQAGEIIKKILGQDLKIWYKAIDQPVTSLDLEIDQFLRQELLKKYPEYGWLSEERADDRERLRYERVWIIDPIDGTKALIRRIPEYVISIGLADRGQPVLGVIYHPINNDLFSATINGPALLNDNPVNCSSVSTLIDATIIVSRTELRAGYWDFSRNAFARIEASGSVALKIAKVAAGQADLHISFKPKNEWDLCAADCIMRAAGGILVNWQGNPIQYNCPTPLIEQSVVAGNQALVAEALSRFHLAG
jgi:myo-inositol-1(or 4)-monophosphatase